ncbi:MAG: hypothetical protein JSR49_15675 [Proteobacteria bacterium]|nr:hypothetical protein [Pseudomonadota bacterium]
MNHGSFLAVVFAACMTAASASAAPVVGASTADTVTSATFKPATDAGGKVTAVDIAARASKGSADEQDGTGDSGWRGYGMLFGTLVLMGIIAVRRQRL